jgi:hypothetical protein
MVVLGGLDIIAYVILGIALTHMGATIAIRCVLACYDYAQRAERRAREDSDVIARNEFQAWKEYGMIDSDEEE